MFHKTSKLHWRKILEFLRLRLTYKSSVSYIQKITNFKEDKWAVFWEKDGEELLNHVTAIYINNIEEGNFKSIEEQKSFKKGLYMLPNLYQKCFNLVETEKYIVKKKEENEKIKKESKLLKKIV